jgi:hypothetical protein
MKNLIARLLRKLFPPAFTVVIEDSRAELRQGKARAAFVTDCTEIAQQQGIDHGVIYGVRKGDRMSLAFSGNIPAGDRQRFRNAWGFHKP